MKNKKKVGDHKRKRKPKRSIMLQMQKPLNYFM